MLSFVTEVRKVKYIHGITLTTVEYTEMIKTTARLALLSLAACFAIMLAGSAASLFFWILTLTFALTVATATLMFVKFLKKHLNK